MQADPQISSTEISPPFSSSAGAMIHRLWRVKLPGGFAPIGLPSTRLCRVKPLSGLHRLAHLLRGFALISLFAQNFLTRRSELLAFGSQSRSTRQRAISMQKAYMIKAVPVLAIASWQQLPLAARTANSAAQPAQSAAAWRDYERLSGTWQLTRAVVDCRPVPAHVVRNTILITDRNTFRFPKASGVGTHPAGSFTVNPDTRPKQVDSIAEGGSNAGQLTRGIYEIRMPTISVPAGVRPVARGRRSLSPLREADGFSNTGRKSVQCLPIDL